MILKVLNSPKVSAFLPKDTMEACKSRDTLLNWSTSAKHLKSTIWLLSWFQDWAPGIINFCFLKGIKRKLLNCKTEVLQNKQCVCVCMCLCIWTYSIWMSSLDPWRTDWLKYLKQKKKSTIIAVLMWSFILSSNQYVILICYGQSIYYLL